MVLQSITKGELFASRKNWQTARTLIQKYAVRDYMRSSTPRACFLCGYSLHIEIAHRRAVGAFPSDATLAEINALSNLVALCRNHHWELDHNLIELTSENRCLTGNFQSHRALRGRGAGRKYVFSVLLIARAGSDVWAMRFSKGGKQRSKTIGSVDTLPTKADAMALARKIYDAAPLFFRDNSIEEAFM